MKSSCCWIGFASSCVFKVSHSATLQETLCFLSWLRLNPQVSLWFSIFTLKQNNSPDLEIPGISTKLPAFRADLLFYFFKWFWCTDVSDPCRGLKTDTGCEGNCTRGCVICWAAAKTKQHSSISRGPGIIENKLCCVAVPPQNKY